MSNLSSGGRGNKKTTPQSQLLCLGPKTWWISFGQPQNPFQQGPEKQKRTNWVVSVVEHLQVLERWLCSSFPQQYCIMWNGGSGGQTPPLRWARIQINPGPPEPKIFVLGRIIFWCIFGFFLKRKWFLGFRSSPKVFSAFTPKNILYMGGHAPPLQGEWSNSTSLPAHLIPWSWSWYHRRDTQQGWGALHAPFCPPPA